MNEKQQKRMRIATWNVNRLVDKKNLGLLISECNASNCDILVLTETDERINPDYKNCFSTPLLKGITNPAIYADTENRVSIFTNYNCIGQYETYDDKTAICVELVTEMGNLLVYGTIIGIAGNRRQCYAEDLKKQLDDISRLTKAGYSVCMVGDYNCSFSDSYYYTKFGRESMLSCFRNNAISILTEKLEKCIDHIAISDAFMKGRRVTSIEEWNQDKRLSDHNGIVLEIE